MITVGVNKRRSDGANDMMAFTQGVPVGKTAPIEHESPGGRDTYTHHDLQGFLPYMVKLSVIREEDIATDVPGPAKCSHGFMKHDQGAYRSRPNGNSGSGVFTSRRAVNIKSL